jgi:hypothetical protein
VRSHWSVRKNLSNWCVLNVLYELPDDDSLGIKTCCNVETFIKLSCFWLMWFYYYLHEYCNAVGWLWISSICINYFTAQRTTDHIQNLVISPKTGSIPSQNEWHLQSDYKIELSSFTLKMAIATFTEALGNLHSSSLQHSESLSIFYNYNIKHRCTGSSIFTNYDSTLATQQQNASICIICLSHTHTHASC